MLNFHKLLVLSFGVFCPEILGNQLPSSFPRCNLQDPNIQGCMRESAQKAVLMMKNGIPELGFPSIDPLQIDSLLLPDLDGPVTLSQSYRNGFLTGLGDVQLSEVTIDPNTYQIKAKGTSPKVNFYGDYEVSGHLLVLPMVGSGKANFTLLNLNTDISLEFNVIKKNDIEYLEISKLHLPIAAEKFIFHYDNLFNGNKTLGDHLNEFINEHSKEVSIDMKPAFETAIDQTFTLFLNQFFTNIPLNELFLK